MDRQRQAILLARQLESWGSDRGWTGTDPYDGLNATRPAVGLLERGALGRRLLIQAVKRSPLNLRPLLGIPPEVSAVSVAWVASAYARGGFLDSAEADSKLIGSLGLLEQLRSSAFVEPCWGYHFDFQSRVVFYRRGEPNTVATAFGGQALLDAHEVLQDDALMRSAREVGRFFLRHVPQTPTEHGSYFGYLPGDRSPIHNSNMLAGALLARLAAASGHAAEFAEPAQAALAYTVSRQRDDGSWPYGEKRGLDWVDNFHTGYVLDALRAYVDAGVDGETAEAAWRRGIRFYARHHFLADGTPKFYASSVYPLDAQSAAQGIQTFARAGRHEPAYAEDAWRVLEFADRRMRRRNGMPLFQRRRLWRNRATHVRWVVAPWLLALADLLRLPEPDSPLIDTEAAALQRPGAPLDEGSRQPVKAGGE